MAEAFEAVKEYLFKYYAGNEIMVIVALVCLLYMLIFEKEIRNKYVIPLLVCILLVVNPILYKYLYSRTYMYWRLFWIFSLHIIIGIALICLIRRIKNDYLKVLVFAASCACSVYFSGIPNVFDNNSLLEYTERENLEKLPPGVVEVCEKILELEDKPKVIGDNQFVIYSRVYSGEIKQLWGRLNFINEYTDKAAEVYDWFINLGDMYGVFEWASKYGYNSVVLVNRISDDYIAAMFGYKEIVTTEGDDVYHLYYKVGVENTDYADMILGQNGQ